MSKSNKRQGSIMLVIVMLFAVVSGFGIYEYKRLSVLEDNIPSYAIKATKQEAIIAAVVLAAVNNGIFVRGTGSSNSLYLPFENSYIVLDKTPYEDLKKHNFVAYTNQNNIKVFHRLIKNTEEGWVAMGDSNPVEDKTRVTKINYIGRLVEPIFTWESAMIK